MYKRGKKYNLYLQRQLSNRIRELKTIYPVGHNVSLETMNSTGVKRLVEFC